MMNKTSSFHKPGRQLTRSIQIGITLGRFSLTKQEREREKVCWISLNIMSYCRLLGHSPSGTGCSKNSCLIEFHLSETLIQIWIYIGGHSICIYYRRLYAICGWMKYLLALYHLQPSLFLCISLSQWKFPRYHIKGPISSSSSCVLYCMHEDYKLSIVIKDPFKNSWKCRCKILVVYN